MSTEVTERLKGIVKDISPMLKEVSLQLDPPTIDDSVSDLDRLNRGLKTTGCDVERMNVGIKVMRELASVMRDEDFNVTVSVIRKKCSNEILGVKSGCFDSQMLGLSMYDNLITHNLQQMPS